MGGPVKRLIRRLNQLHRQFAARKQSFVGSECPRSRPDCPAADKTVQTPWGIAPQQRCEDVVNSATVERPRHNQRNGLHRSADAQGTKQADIKPSVAAIRKRRCLRLIRLGGHCVPHINPGEE